MRAGRLSALILSLFILLSMFSICALAENGGTTEIEPGSSCSLDDDFYLAGSASENRFFRVNGSDENDTALVKLSGSVVYHGAGKGDNVIINVAQQDGNYFNTCYAFRVYPDGAEETRAFSSNEFTVQCGVTYRVTFKNSSAENTFNCTAKVTCSEEADNGEIEPNGSIGSATTLVLNESGSCSIRCNLHENDTDYFSIRLSGGKKLSCVLEHSYNASGGAFARAEILTRDGQGLFSGSILNSATGSRFETTVPSDGTYLIRIVGNNESEAAYTLTVTVSNAAETETSAPAGTDTQDENPVGGPDEDDPDIADNTPSTAATTQKAADPTKKSYSAGTKSKNNVAGQTSDIIVIETPDDSEIPVDEAPQAAYTPDEFEFEECNYNGKNSLEISSYNGPGQQLFTDGTKVTVKIPDQLDGKDIIGIKSNAFGDFEGTIVVGDNICRFGSSAFGRNTKAVTVQCSKDSNAATYASSSGYNVEMVENAPTLNARLPLIIIVSSILVVIAGTVIFFVKENSRVRKLKKGDK